MPVHPANTQIGLHHKWFWFAGFADRLALVLSWACSTAQILVSAKVCMALMMPASHAGYFGHYSWLVSSGVQTAGVGQARAQQSLEPSYAGLSQ